MVAPCDVDYGDEDAVYTWEDDDVPVFVPPSEEELQSIQAVGDPHPNVAEPVQQVVPQPQVQPAPQQTLVQPAPAVAPIAAPAPAPPAPQPTTQSHFEAVSATVGAVLRELFKHVYTKCEFNTAGGFNNPYGVLDAVPIEHIEGATALFTHYDSIISDNYRSDVPAEGVIRGVVSQGGLPSYKLTINIGGTPMKYTFICQNPNKMKGDQLSPWAQSVQAGAKIMMLLAPPNTGQGILMHVKMDAHQTEFGQEEVKLWSKK